MNLAAPSLHAHKSPEAFRTISEVAAELGVPQHVLRFWETRFTQVHPLKRAGRRRYYRPEDVALLRGIQSLLYGQGYTIKGVQKILRERGIRHVTEIGSPEPRSHRSGPGIETPEEPRFARAVIARVQRAHDVGLASARTAEICEAVHGRLRALLGELSGMKDRLRTAREYSSAGVP